MDHSLLNLRRVEQGETEAIPLIYSLQTDIDRAYSRLESYTPFDGGATRLVAVFNLGPDICPCVWDTGSGAFLGPLDGVGQEFWSLVAYQRSSDRRPRIAAG
jgi:hypothetical protein